MTEVIWEVNTDDQVTSCDTYDVSIGAGMKH